MRDLSELRPADGSASEIRAALERIEAERRDASNRILNLRLKRAELLVSGTNEQIVKLESEVRQHEIWLERLAILAPSIEVDLPAATATELLQDLEQTRAAAMLKVKAARLWTEKEYGALQKKLTVGKKLEVEALVAMSELGSQVANALRAHRLDEIGGLPPGFIQDLSTRVRRLSDITMPSVEEILAHEHPVASPAQIVPQSSQPWHLA